MGVSAEMANRIRSLTEEELIRGIEVMSDVVDLLYGDLKHQLDFMKGELRYRCAVGKMQKKSAKRAA